MEEKDSVFTNDGDHVSPAEGNASPAGERPLEAPGVADGVKEKKIIIADDSESFIMYLGILMRRLGLKAVPARNGLEVLKLITVFRPDLILLDVTMPVMDGATVLRHVKADETTADTPVIMVSVRDDIETIRHCEELGCSGYLTKPVSLPLLHEVVYDNLTFRRGRKRRSFRTHYGGKVLVECHGKRYEYYAVSLSEGGIYLRTRNPFPVGTAVRLAISLSPDRTVETRGTVIYQKDVFENLSSIDPGMAIAFTGLSQEDARALRNDIQTRLVGDLVDEQDEPIITIEGSEPLAGQ